MNIKDILAKIGATQGPLARQLLMTGLITRRLAFSYDTREVYFTADIDLA